MPNERTDRDSCTGGKYRNGSARRDVFMPLESLIVIYNNFQCVNLLTYVLIIDTYGAGVNYITTHPGC